MLTHKIETYAHPFVKRNASGYPSILQTTLAAFLFHPWSQTALHSSSYFTSTRPSNSCFPPISLTSVPPANLRQETNAISKTHIMLSRSSFGAVRCISEQNNVFLWVGPLPEGKNNYLLYLKICVDIRHASKSIKFPFDITQRLAHNIPKNAREEDYKYENFPRRRI